MKGYRCHKYVTAARIIGVTVSGSKVAELELDDGTTIIPQPELTAPYHPVVGDYLVKYEDGYMSLSPAKAFEDGYSPVKDDSALFNFSQALELVKNGARLARTGWNGKGMFIFLVPGSEFKVNRPPLLGIYPEGTEIKYHGHVDMRTADGQIVPWLCSQTDMLAEDWAIVL